MTRRAFDPWTLDSCELWRLERSGDDTRVSMLCRQRADGAPRRVALSLEGVTQFTPPHPAGDLCEVEAWNGRWSEIDGSFACEFAVADVSASAERWAEERDRLTQAALLSDRAPPADSLAGQGVVESITGWNHPDLTLVDRLGPCAVEVRVRASSGEMRRLLFGGVRSFDLPLPSRRTVDWSCESARNRGWSTADGRFVVDGRPWFHYASRRTASRATATTP